MSDAARYLEIAAKYDQLGRPQEAAAARARAAEMSAAAPPAPAPRAPAPAATAPAATAPRMAAPTPAPARTSDPARAARPAAPTRPVQPPPVADEQRWMAAQDDYASLAADEFVQGRIGPEEFGRITGYATSSEDMARLQALRTQVAQRRGASVQPAPKPVPILPPLASSMMPAADEAGFEAGAPVYGRPVDEPQLASQLRERLQEMEIKLTRQYIGQGYTVEGAQEAARKASLDVLSKRVTPEGEPTTRGEGSLGTLIGAPPFFRESRIDFRNNPNEIKDPNTGQTRPATSNEKLLESFARQPVVTPEMAAQARQVRAVQRELAFRDIPGSMLYTDEYAADVRKEIVDASDPFFRGLFSSVDPGTGVGIETPLGAAIRGTGLISTALNEAALGLPLYYDVDDNGDPVDTNQFAFKVNDFLTRSLERMGVSSEDAKDLTSGVIGGQAVPLGLPVPFQGVNRKGKTIIDPIGMRSAGEAETYLGAVTTSLAKGRFAGDELYSMPAYVQELATGAFDTRDPGTGDKLKDVDESAIGQAALFYPMIIGAGAEMVYGIGPISAAGKLARLTGGAAKAGALGAAKMASSANLLRTAEALKTGARAADFAAAPVEYAKKVKLIRAAQDLMDDAQLEKPVLDTLMDRSEIKTIVSEKISQDVLVPYLLASLVQTKSWNQSVSAGDLRTMAGDSATGQEFLRQMGVLDTTPDAAIWGRGTMTQERLAEALLTYRVSANRPAIEAIMRGTSVEADKAARLYDLLTSTEIDTLSRMTVDERAAFARLNPTDQPPLQIVSDLQRVAQGGGQPGELDNIVARLSYSPKYFPISPDAPIMQSLHAFGDQVSRGVPRQGPLVESFGRRLGGEKFFGEAGAPLAWERVQPELGLLREAAIGAGARSVASTLENVVPEDLVMVTDTLMVPRQRLTAQVLDEVGAVYNDFARAPGVPLSTAVPGPVINGRQTLEYRWNILNSFVSDQVFGRLDPRRSPIKSAIIRKLGDDELLTEAEHHYLSDALLGQAYRDVLGESRVSEAIFAGEQTAAAARPSVGLGLLSAAQERVPGLRTGEAMPAQSRSAVDAREPSMFSVPSQALAIAREALGSGVRRAAKATRKIDYAPFKTKFPSQTPFANELTMRRIEDAVAAIPDTFQREVRAAALEPGVDAEQAFDRVLGRRIVAAVLESEQALQRRVDDLVEQGVAEAEAWTTVAYQQRAGMSAGGLGTQLQGGVISEAKLLAQSLATQEVKSKSWATMLNSFFGPLYTRLIGFDEQALRRYIVRETADGEAVVDVTLANFREVLGKIRRDNPELALRGMQRPSVPYGEAAAGFFGWMGKQDPRNLGPVRLMNDAVLDVTAAWAMGMDRQRIVAREATAALDANPWMRTDLAYGQTTDSLLQLGKVRNAAVTARSEVASELYRLSARNLPQPVPEIAADVARQAERAFVDERLAAGVSNRIAGTPFAAGGNGKYSAMLDDLTVRSWRNLTPAAKRDLIDAIYGRMLQDGRGTPDLRTVLHEGLDDPRLNLLFFEKLATTRTIQLMIEGLRSADSAAQQAGQRLVPSDRNLLAYINEAADSGASEFEIVGAVRRALLRNAINSFVAPAIEEMQLNAKSYGWAPDLEQSRRNITTMVDQLSPQDPRFAVAGQDFVAAISKLQAASKDGKLAENLENLARSEKLQRALGGEVGAAGDYAAQVLLDTLALPRSVAAAGLLGGGFYVLSDDSVLDGTPFGVVPLPNTRYLGTNLLTAPLIAATTLGATGAIRYLRPRGGATAQAGEVALQASAQLPEVLRRPLVDSIGQRPGDASEVLIRTRTGKEISRGELDQLMREHNISLTRGGLEFANSFARDLARDARLTAEGIKAPALRQYMLRNMDPTRTGFWQYAANATDRTFRQNVFATGLEEGLQPAQAAQLARNVVLDYGNVKFTGGLNKYVMFLAFREAMTREVIEAVLRDPDTFQRTMLLHRNLQQQMDDELLADHTRFRIPVGGGKIFDQTASSRVYGPINPALSVYGDLVRFAAMALQVGAKDVPTGSIAAAVADESLTPIVDMIMADAIARPSSTGRGQKVDDVHVAYLIQNSPDTLWPWIKETYNIVPVAASEERKGGRLEAQDPQVPGLGRVEYRFATPQDHARYIRDLAIMQTLGFQRTMEDYTKMGLTYGVEDYIDPKRRGLPSTFGFAFGLETPLSAQSQMGAVTKALQQQLGATKASTPRD